MPVVIMIDEPTHSVDKLECEDLECICHIEQAWDELQATPSYVSRDLSKEAI